MFKTEYNLEVVLFDLFILHGKLRGEVIGKSYKEGFYRKIPNRKGSETYKPNSKYILSTR